MDIYQISGDEIVCFACHDDLLFSINHAYQKKADYRLDFAGIKRFFSSRKKIAASPEIPPENHLVPLGNFRFPEKIMSRYGG
jgi:hypothetical protein